MEATHSISDLTGLAPSTLLLFLSLGLIGVVGLIVFGRRSKGLQLETGDINSRMPRDKVVIVGPVGAGKT
jgi:hypothetical protein